MGKLPVHLTIDVECAESRVRGGVACPPLGYAPRVWGRFPNVEGELGVGRLAADLRARDLRATFYVEPLGARYFGLSGLREVVACLLEHDQDVQLHLHPTQRDPEARLRGAVPPNDDVGAYALAEQTALLREGLDLLVDAGVPRERLIAFRAGNFGASNATWRACVEAGLRLSSNYDPGYFDVSCAMRHEAARADVFVPVPGLLELPISCVRTSRGKLRHLQLTAMSFLEMRGALRRMRALGYAAATLVSHSFELYTIGDREGLVGRPSRVNVGRWEALLDFLARERDAFPTESALDLVARLSGGIASLGPPPEPPRTPPLLEVVRLAEQVLKRLEPYLPTPALPSPRRA
jgi:hypothetical protein